MIYLDNAATSIDKPKAVADAIYEGLMSKKYGNPSRGAYPQSINSLRELYDTRRVIGEFFGFSDPQNVVLSPNVTYGLNYIISSLFDSEDHIITSITEHNSVLRPLYQLESYGASLDFLDIDENYNIKTEDLEKYLKKNTKGVVITAASNVSGKITNLKEVNEFTKKHNLILVVDGAQISGCTAFSLEEYENIIFAFTGHKSLHGPQGTGGFIVKGDFDFKQVFSGGSGFDSFSKAQPHHLPELFEPGTENVHSFMGLKAAILELEKDTSFYNTLLENTKLLHDGLREIKDIVIYSPWENKNTPIVSFNIKGIDAHEIGEILWDEYEICSRIGSHCAPLFHQRVGTKETGIVRLSLSSYNTKEEVLKAIDAVKEIANTYK